MKLRSRSLLFCLGLLSAVYGQEVPMALPIEDLVAKQDQTVLDRQGTAIFELLDRVGERYRSSVVGVVAGRHLLASGVVVAPGKVMTKYSDLKLAAMPLAVVDADGKVYDMRVAGYSRENDVALLDVPGLEKPPVDLSDPVEAAEGSIIFLYSPEGKATNFGVISVAPRSLRESDQPFIGIGGDMSWQGNGAYVNGVVPQSPAHKAGLRPGDVINEVNGKGIDGYFSLRSVLNGVNPGDKVRLTYTRNGRREVGELVAGSRPSFNYPQRRLDQMNKLGGHRLSRVRQNFPYVYQSDLTLLPERAGSPVIDLEGRFVGLALSRAGRMETYILPASVVKKLTDKALATPGREEIPVAEPVEG